MTDTLIQRLRRHRGDYVEEMDEAADALEQQAAQIAEKDAEIAQLTECLSKANANHEHFERAWYLRGDEVEALRADAARWRHVQHGFAAQSVAIDGMHSWTWRGYHMIGKGANIDEAVDAALRQEGPKP